MKAMHTTMGILAHYTVAGGIHAFTGTNGFG